MLKTCLPSERAFRTREKAGVHLFLESDTINMRVLILDVNLCEVDLIISRTLKKTLQIREK